MISKKSIAADVIKKYRDAIMNLKTLTQKEEGVVLGTIKLCAEYKVSNYFFIAMQQLNYVEKRVVAGMPATYIWRKGYIDISDTQVVKAIETTRKLEMERKTRSKEEVQTPNSSKTVMKQPRVLALKEGYFTSQHFKLMEQLTFAEPTTIKLGDEITVINARKITFDVNKSDLFIHFLIHPLNDMEASEREFIEVLVVKFTNKALQFEMNKEAHELTIQGHNYY